MRSNAQVTADAELRFNPVYSRGFRLPLYEGEQPGFYTMQRTRLIVNYLSENDLKVEVVVQDRRFWGDESERADLPTLTLFRGWAEKYFSNNWSLKLGRQGLAYDDQYLFGERNWGGTMAHDVALLKYEGGLGKLHVGAAFNSNGGELKREHYEQKMYKTLQFAWFNKQLGRLKTSLIFINNGEESADTVVHYTQTFGTNTTLSLTDDLELKAIYYHQLGEDTESKAVNAHLLSLQSIYKLSPNAKFTFGADINSGTNALDMSNPEYNQNNTFDRKFGLLHGQFGRLDYFFVKKSTTQGIRDYYIKADIKANKLRIRNELHGFANDQDLANPIDGQVVGAFLGIENDLRLGYKFSSTFSATFGHSIMFGTSSLDAFFGGTPISDSQFFYAVVTVNPKLYNSSSK